MTIRHDSCRPPWGLSANPGSRCRVICAFVPLNSFEPTSESFNEVFFRSFPVQVCVYGEPALESAEASRFKKDGLIF
jgi:hypothetical protein